MPREVPDAAGLSGPMVAGPGPAAAGASPAAVPGLGTLLGLR